MFATVMYLFLFMYILTYCSYVLCILMVEDIFMFVNIMSSVHIVV